MTEQPAKNRADLYRKISAVTAAVSRIPKNGFNKFFNYAYATESDITDELRALLHEHGLAFLPPSVVAWERSETTKKNGERGDDLTRVQIQFGLACCDTGEVFTALLWGEGQDGSDKGFYKAYTGAVKYFLMKTFLIATGDDPERDDEPRQQQQRQAPAQRQTPHPRQQNAPAPAPAPNGKKPATRNGLIKRIEDLEGLIVNYGLEHNRESFDAYTDEQLIEMGKRLKAAFDKAEADAIEAEAPGVVGERALPL